MPRNVLAGDVGSILDRRIDAADRLLVVNPDGDSISGLVETLTAHDDPPRVSLLAGDRLLKDVMNDFLVASRAADLIEDDSLELRVVAEPPNQSLLVTEDDVVALVAVADGVGELQTTDDAFVEAASEHYGELFADAEPHRLRTPPLSTVRETLASDLGEGTAADFDAVLESLDRVRDDAGLDGVAVSVLVAARNRELLYDISKWGEDVGLASKATFSRTKTTLEDAGVIATEKVPIQVGRPRLRLKLGDERLADADPDEMAARASQMLAP